MQCLPPLLPFGNQGVVMECGLSEPWLVEIHLLGMHCCGGCRWPPGEADQPVLGLLCIFVPILQHRNLGLSLLFLSVPR